MEFSRRTLRFGFAADTDYPYFAAVRAFGIYRHYVSFQSTDLCTERGQGDKALRHPSGVVENGTDSRNRRFVRVVLHAGGFQNGRSAGNGAFGGRVRYLYHVLRRITASFGQFFTKRTAGMGEKVT